MWFEQVIGQQATISRLKELVDRNILPHAILISGEDGYGGLAMALGLAEYVNCSGEKKPCGECHSCKQMAALDHPDVHFSFPIIHEKTDDTRTCQDYKSIFIETIQSDPYLPEEEWSKIISGGDTKKPIIYANEAEAHIEKVLAYAPVQDGYKICIIWQPEKMNGVCANRLLKTIEEPSGKALIILVSSHPDEILGTILSRCQQIMLSPIEAEQIEQNIIAQNAGIDVDKAHEVAHNSMGNWLVAQNMISANEQIDSRFEVFKQIMRASVVLNIENVIAVSDVCRRMPREECIFMFDYAQHLIRENLLLRLGVEQMQYLSSQEREFSVKFSNFIHEANAEDIMEAFALAQKQIAQNANANVVVFDLCTQLYFLLKRSRPEE